MSLIPTREETPRVIQMPNRNGSRTGVASVASPAQGMTGRDIMQIIRRRKLLIILFTVLFTVAASVGTYVWRQKAPYYDAEALLMVVPQKQTELRADRENLPKDTMERIMQSHVQSIRSNRIYNKALQNKDLQKTSWFQKRYAKAGIDLAGELDDAIRISAVPTTTLLRITMRDHKRKDAAQIVNSVGQAAVEDAKSSTEEGNDEAFGRLKRARDDVYKRLKKNQDSIEESHKKGLGGETFQERNTLLFMAQSLIQRKTEAQSEYINALKAWESIKSLTDEELRNLPEIRRVRDYHPVIHSLELRVLELENSIARTESKLGPGHTDVRDLRNSLQTMRKQLEQKEEEIVRQAIGDMKMQMQNDLAAREADFLSLSDEAAQVEKKLRALESAMVELETLESEIQKDEETLQTLDMRLLDLDLLKQSQPPLKMHREAVPPARGEISFPRFQIMVPLGFLLGASIGFGLAFLLEFMDTSIKGPGDVTRRVELPLLGMIPHLDDIEEEIDDMRVAFRTAPGTLISEAFRQVRTTLMYSGPIETRRSLLVTSPMPEDGRTAVCLNLAQAVAQGGKRVLVVDANFRQPMLRTLFPDCPDAGLSSVLTGQHAWRSLVHEIEPNLFVMSSGPIPPNPGELLGSDSMRQLIAEFSEEFDQIIFDSAPCLVVSDACVLSTACSATVLVVRAGVNTYGIVQRTRDMLNRLGAHIVGVVLNGVRVTAGGYLRKNYDTFYEYNAGSRPQLPAVPSQSPPAPPVPAAAGAEAADEDDDEFDLDNLG